MPDKTPGAGSLETLAVLIAREREAAAEAMTFRGVLRCRRAWGVAFAREGLAAADFTDPAVGVLYEWCLTRWQRDTPTTMVDVYRGVRHEQSRGGGCDHRLRCEFFGRPFARWLADAFTCEWWPADPRWATAEFADGRADAYPQDLFLATVAARWVHVLAERRRELDRRHRELAALFKAPVRASAGSGTVRIFKPDEEDDDVETRGPRRR